MITATTWIIVRLSLDFPVEVAMLLRAAIVLLSVLFTGAAAIFAAGHFGVSLPWAPVATQESAPTPSASQDREQPPAQDAQQTEKEAEASSNNEARSPETVIEETVAALGNNNAAAPAPGSVALDISRVATEGTSVFAGRAEPGSYVTVLENGKPAGTARADADGDWSLATEYKFASTDPALTFEVSSTAPAAPAPPEPEKKAEEQVAEAAPKSEPAAPETSAAEVASDVMKKFENLVSEAREDAKREAEEKTRAEQEKRAEEERRTEEARKAEIAKAEQEKIDREKADRETAEREKAEREKAEREVAEREKAEQEKQIAAAAESKTDDRPSAAADKANSEQPAAEAKPAAAPADETTSKTADAKVAANDDDREETQVAAAAAAGGAAKRSGDVPAAIPVPIMFVYNQATLTSEGKRAADLLLEYLTLKRLSSVELTGHADERGTIQYNYDLSRERLEAVSSILKAGGYTGELKLTPKGKTEPYTGVDRTKYRGEALHQLDRRVELRITH